MAGFGYNSGRRKLDFRLAVDFMRYMDYFTRTNLKWVALFGALVGFIAIKILLINATGLTLLAATVGAALYVSYPFYLIMALTGERSVGKVIVLNIVTAIATLLVGMVPVLGLFAGLIGFVLAIGFVYPDKITLTDSILVYIVMAIIGIALLLLTGATVFGTVLLGQGVTQAIVPNV